MVKIWQVKCSRPRRLLLPMFLLCKMLLVVTSIGCWGIVFSPVFCVVCICKCKTGNRPNSRNVFFLDLTHQTKKKLSSLIVL